MSLLSYVKAGIWKAAGAYSKQACPWDPFDRPPLFKANRTLEDRASECFDDLQAAWFFDEILPHRVPIGGGFSLDLGDQAIWQGIFTAILCFKYARAKSDILARYIKQALDGMYQHQYFHGEAEPRLIRGYDRNSGKWQDDASNDSLTGHFAGLYFAFRFGPPELKAKALDLISTIARELINHNLQLVKADGTPTTYGKLINGPLTEPLQMTLVLAILTVAEHYGLHGKAGQMRDEIYSKYWPMIPYPKFVFGVSENWNDDHRAAIHLAILAMEDKSPRMQKLVRAGLLRLWDVLGQRGNIWMNALIMLGLNGPPLEEMTRQANIVLGEYELREKRYDLEFDCRGTQVGDTWTGSPILSVNGDVWTPDIITIAGHQRATQPLPLHLSGRQSFVWERHRYSACDWLGATQPTQRFTGMDYLGAYHLSVLTGILPYKPLAI